MVKVRDGQVRNRPVYAAIGVDLLAQAIILGMWAGDGDGESAKYWYAVLTDLEDRGVRDVFFVVWDGLKACRPGGTPCSPPPPFRPAVIHLIRGSIRYASREVLGRTVRDLKPIYQAPNEAAAAGPLDAPTTSKGPLPRDDQPVAGGIRNEFIPFLDYDMEIRRVLCSTQSRSSR